MSRVPTTRPKLSWSDLAGARVGVWGLGREGHASLRKLLALGAEPVLVDDHPPADADGRPVLATADGGLAALERCDVVVKTPGLSRYRPEVVTACFGWNDIGLRALSDAQAMKMDAFSVGRRALVCRSQEAGSGGRSSWTRSGPPTSSASAIRATL